MPQDPEAARALSLVHGQVCYLQLPAANSKRAAAFYEAVFGWDIGTHYPDFESPGLIGQWVEGRPPAREAGPMIWLAVADMTGTLDQVTAHGGGILEPPAPDGPARTLATVVDPEGNPIGLAGHSAHRPGRPQRRPGRRPQRRPHPAAITDPEDSAPGGTNPGKPHARQMVTV